MSTDGPERQPRIVSSSAGGGWIIGIIVVVLIGLGIWWWVGTSEAAPSANTGAGTPAGTTGASGNPIATPPAPNGVRK